MSSSWGKHLRLSVFGESHGPAVGMTLEGLPPGQHLDMAAIAAFLARRRPHQGAGASSRAEDDQPLYLSGLKDNATSGTPLCAIIENRDARRADYATPHIPRPGHADFSALARYGAAVDISGGGHFSGRLTAPLCLAGAICLQILARHGITVGAHVAAVGGIADCAFDPLNPSAEAISAPGRKRFPVIDDIQGAAMQEAIRQAAADGDSLGGIIECAALGLPAGIGGPLFAGLESRLAAALFAIPGVKGLEFGAGFAAANSCGTQMNDAYCLDAGAVRTQSNHHGGILGGISSGMPLLLRLAIKPTPSIASPQASVDLQRARETTISTVGRHDACIAPRAVPVAEALTALVLLDAIMEIKGESL